MSENCRFCKTPLNNLFVSLGKSPLSNAYLSKEQLQSEEMFFPLDVYVCEKCFLVQLPEHEKPDQIFTEYAYFSSYSDSWLAHCKNYVEHMMTRHSFAKDSQVIEIASNDGYLLQYFKEKDIPVLGIEPAQNVADVAIEKGIPTEKKFFGIETAQELSDKGIQADLLLGNNVLAHVPDINDFVAGMKILLKSNGVITMEFPHLWQLIKHNQFDTIYHEHFSYLSLITVQKIFAHHGLKIFDVEELLTHGGSLRIYAAHQEDDSKAITSNVDEIKKREISTGFEDIAFYKTFDQKARAVREHVLSFFQEAKKNNKSIVGYGAAAKGNTLLNYCGLNQQDISYVVDRNPYKQGKYLPGTHIPIEDPVKIKESKPDYVFILPWNIKDEIVDQMSFVRDWGGQFVVPIPDVEVVS